MESRRTGTHNLVRTIAGLRAAAERSSSASRRSATTATAATSDRRRVRRARATSFDAEVVQEWEARRRTRSSRQACAW